MMSGQLEPRRQGRRNHGRFSHGYDAETDDDAESSNHNVHTLNSSDDGLLQDGHYGVRSDDAPIDDRRVTALSSLSLDDEGASQARVEYLDAVTYKVGSLENTEQILNRLRRADETHVRQTFAYGMQIQSAPGRESAVVRVGIDFLPGSNRPEVTRLEQDLYDKRPPDQRSAEWRVGTARTLLSNFAINADMSISSEDMSMQIANESTRRASYRKLHRKRDHSRNPSRMSSSSSGDSNRLSKRTHEKKYIVIDSNYVKLVNDLRNGSWDVEATLIEVDEKALLDVMINCRNLIQKRGPEMTNSETKDLLETMIEDARRLFVRSPILSRMSTRRHIIHSKDT